MEKYPNKMTVCDVSVHYGDKRALGGVSLDIPENQIIALIGASGCGKSTFLRCLNRMNDEISGCRVAGEILLDEQNIYAQNVDPVLMRARVGMVIQKPNPFPKSIFDNIAFGPRIHEITQSEAELKDIVHSALERVGMIDEVKNRLGDSAIGLSSGQQQRICIARAVAIAPEGVLMDEPCSALDPIATAKIEGLIEALAADYTIVIVTHSMQQAARISQRSAFFHLGELIEVDGTSKIFTSPNDPRTENYITGRFG